MLWELEPDIAYAVGQLSRFSDKYGDKHIGAVKRIFRYLAGTKQYGITYIRDISMELKLGIQLQGFCDADWAGDPSTRRSVSGFVYTLTSGSIAWASKMQTVTAQSTAEAEYISACDACKEGKALIMVIREILEGIKSNIVLGIDSSSAYTLATNPTYNRRTRHIEIRYHYIRELIASNDLTLVKVNGIDNPADLLTKAVDKKTLLKLREKLGIMVTKELK